MNHRAGKHRCPDCTQTFDTQAELDEHVLAARHWDDSPPRRRRGL